MMWIKTAFAKTNAFLDSLVGWVENTWVFKRLEAWEYDPPPLPLSKIVRYGAVILVMLIGSFWWGRFTAPVKMRMPLSLMSEAPRPADPNVALALDNASLEQENAKLRDLVSSQTAIAKAKHERLLVVEKELAELRSITKLSEDSVKESDKPKVRYVRVKEKTFLCEVAGVCD